MLPMLAKHVTEIVLRLDPVKVMILAAIASLTLCNARMLCLLLRVEWGRVALVTTDLLSPNM